MLSDTELSALLNEDVPYGDLTTEAFGIADERGWIRFAARGDMILACAEEAERMLTLAGAAPRRLAASGDRLAAGQVFLAADGRAGALHRAWKMTQNLLEHASGVASAVRAIADGARAVNPGIVVECTRKNVPGTRAIAVRAVHAGGGRMHRLGLSESILVFPEHRVFVDRPDAAAARLAALKGANIGKKVTVETADLDEAEALARAGADIIQLEKLPPDAVAAVVARLSRLVPRPLVAVAGGVNAGNVADYATAGADIIVTSAPYWARPADVKVTIGRGPLPD